MSIAAIMMMTLAIVLVWGGLVVAMIHLVRHPDETSGHLPNEAWDAADEEAFGAPVDDDAPAHRV